MPLVAMSPNIAMASPGGKKRSHDDFVKGENDSIDTTISGNCLPQQPSLAANGKPSNDDAENVPPTSSKSTASPASMATPSKAPPAKRKKYTPAEKEEKAKLDAAKKAEREAAKAVKDAEKAAKEAEKEQEAKVKAAAKAAKDAEKEQEAKIKAAKKAERDAAKAAKDAEKAAKDAEKAAKEAEKLKKQKAEEEAQQKKERSQMKLKSFFSRGPSTPAKKANLSVDAAGSSPINSPLKLKAAARSEYEKSFQPFFLKEHVSLADVCLVDEEGKEAKGRILDEYLQQKRTPFEPEPWNPNTVTQYFKLPSRPTARGRKYHNVRKVMAILNDQDSHQTRATRDMLKSVPMKYLGFYQDVRPAYYGTITNVPAGASLAKLGRNPISKKVLPLDYDYDSEAEWNDDGEEGDGEDLNDSADEEDQDLEDDEEFGEFLDNADDAAPSRMAFAAGMEPESTGCCWEDRTRLGPKAHMYKYRLEFILPTLKHHNNIDPFSTEYWEREKPCPSKAHKDSPPKGSTIKTVNDMMMPPPPAPSSSVGSTAPASDPNATPESITKGRMLADQLLAFKRSILDRSRLSNGKLSKVGLIEVLGAEYDCITKAMVKGLIELMAERVGKGQNKRWQLKAGYELPGE